MTALSPKLGAAKHFVIKSEDGEADPGNANYRNIQGHFVRNYSKIEDAQNHSVSYDFMEIILVRKVVDPTANFLWEKYGEGTINLFEDWTHLTIHQVKEWQSDINHQGDVENRRLSEWLLAFFVTPVPKDSRMELRIQLRAWNLLRRVELLIST